MALNPEQITALRDAFGKIAEPVTAWLLRDAAERIALAGKMTSTANYELYRAKALGESQWELKKYLKRQLKLSNREIRKLFRQAARMSRDNDEERVGLMAGADIEQMTAAAVKLAQKDFSNLTQTLGMMTPGGKVQPLRRFYQETMDFAFEQIFTGAADYQTAIRQATTKMADAGVRTIDYESGRSIDIEAAVRRNMMGGMGLLDEQITQANHEALGCNGWEISAHANSAPDHEPYQGRQYSDVEWQKLNGTAQKPGLLKRRIGTLHCGHVAFPIILGVNSPQYTEAQLRAFREDNAKGITYEGKHYTGYEATQKQRQLERAQRKQKRRILVANTTGDTLKEQAAQIRLQMLRQHYKAFSKAAGLPLQEERAWVAGFKKSTRKENTKDLMRCQLDALTQAEKAQITQYTGFDASKINFAIRHNKITDAVREKIVCLDSALQKGVVPNAITLYRETSLSFLRLDNGQEVTKDNILDYIGQDIVNPIFSSSSWKKLDLPGRDTVIILRVPAGYRGALYIQDLALPQYRNQDEVLFARGLCYRIEKVDIEGEKVYIEAEVIKHEAWEP